MKSTTKEVKAKINAHILKEFENQAADELGGITNNADRSIAKRRALGLLKRQVAVFDNLPTDYAKGKHMAEGGTFLIYYEEQREFLNSLGINPEAREYPDHKVFEQYCHLIGRQIAELVKA
jgi:hypothetical protein